MYPTLPIISCVYSVPCLVQEQPGGKAQILFKLFEDPQAPRDDSKSNEFQGIIESRSLPQGFPFAFSSPVYWDGVSYRIEGKLNYSIQLTPVYPIDRASGKGVPDFDIKFGMAKKIRCTNTVKLKAHL